MANASDPNLSDSQYPNAMADEAVEDQDSEFLAQFLKEQHKLYSYVHSVSLQWDVAEEVFQRVSLALWKKRNDYNPEYPFIGWAIGFAKTEIRKFSTEQHQQPVLLEENAIDALSEYFVQHNDIAETKLLALDECLSNLPQQKREIVTKYYSSQTKVQEVANFFSMTEANLYQQLSRIRKRLYRCITSKMTEGDGHTFPVSPQ